MAISQVRAQINGVWYTLALNSSTGKYEANITPTADSSAQPGGYFNTTVEATSTTAGTVTVNGSTMASLRLIVEDNSPPTLTVTNPAADMPTAENTITVKGAVTSRKGIRSVTVNGKSVTVSPNGSFQIDVPLQEGENTITIVATDNDGRTTTIIRKVTRGDAPIVTVITPTEGLTTYDEKVPTEVVASSNWMTITEATIGGVKAALSGGKFTGDLTLIEGRNVVTVTAANQIGLTDSESFVVTLDLRDVTPPQLTVTNPAGNIYTNQARLTVRGTATDVQSGVASVTVNGQQAALTGDDFSLDITLQEGVNTITVVATDNEGNAATVTRSVHLDTQPPVIILISPAEGWINDPRPTVLFRVTDEPGGSGVDMTTAEISLDGVRQTSGVTISGADITFRPPQAMADTYHVITVTVRDRAGNQRGLSVTYGVDTVPPELHIQKPDEHRVVDVAEYPVTGWAIDEGSGFDYVSSGTARASPDEGGRFILYVPLEVGENTFTVTARDKAGNTVSETFYMIRLITDRVPAHVAAVESYYKQPVTEWTAADKERFQTAILWGAYTEKAMNRVGIAVGYIAGELEKRGYALFVSPKTDWTRSDAPTRTQGETYRRNVETIRDAQNIPELTGWEIPETMRYLNHEGANQLEKALVETDAIFPNYQSWTSGEISCGES